MPTIFNYYRTFDECDALPMISREHKLIHDSELFYHNTLFENVAAGATVAIYADTPANVYVHSALSVSSTAEFHVKSYEDIIFGTDITDKGTLVDALNRNRNSDNVAAISLYDAPTIVDAELVDNLLIREARLGTGRTSGGEARADREIILKPSTGYLVTVTNESNNQASINIVMDFYEQPLGE